MISHLGSDRSDVGLGLARELGRPCIDIAAAGLERRPRFNRAGDEPAQQVDAERAWFQAVSHVSTPQVIVAPCSIAALLDGPGSSDEVWSAWLDTDHCTLIERARTTIAEPELENFSTHLSRHDGSELCDAVIDTRSATHQQIVERIVEAIHAQ